MMEMYQEIVNLISRGERAVLATVVSSGGSVPRRTDAKMLIKSDGTFLGTVGGGGVELKVIDMAPEVIHSGQSQLLHFDLSGEGEKAAMICGGTMDVFLEPILPLETLYFFGAGHISEAAAKLAKPLGFRITVVDPRPEFNNKERFPDVESNIIEPYTEAFLKLNIGSDSYVVICTPGHVFDEQCLHFAVGTKATYIGMIGSKKKVKDVKERLINKGVLPQNLEKVHAPIGLEIGAETPYEIAISILAEIIKIKRIKI
ncbi:MAG: XdhC/CoxI family protein [Thermodesulfobacteriota bacterium]|jgi:xanthine dehydrogenase accessory factor